MRHGPEGGRHDRDGYGDRRALSRVRPSARSKETGRERGTYGSFCEVVLVRLHVVRRYLHIVEHALELRSELRPALDLQLRQHAALRIVRDRSTEEQTLGKVSLVIPFEHVFVREVSEYSNGFVEHGVHFQIGFL